MNVPCAVFAMLGGTSLQEGGTGPLYHLPKMLSLSRQVFAPSSTASLLLKATSSRCAPTSLGGIVRSFAGGQGSALINTDTSCNRPLPVGIFVDLDNVAQETKALSTHTREEAAKFASPLRQFAETAGELRSFLAFANQHTLTYVGNEERERREQSLAFPEEEAEVWDWDAFPEEEAEEWGPEKWDKDASISGFDEKGMLRCGVCGARMKLTKKDKKAGRDIWGKLDKHMRELHDREQEKRRTRLNHKTKKGRKKPGWAKLSEKEMKKFRKYEASQIGLHRKPALRVKKKGGNDGRQRTDLYRVLREEKIKVAEVPDADKSLVKAANKWMKKTKQQPKGYIVEPLNKIYGCLVVVSEDADFVELMNKARADFVVVTATPNSTIDDQTRKLLQVSDVVLGLDAEEDNDSHIDDSIELYFDPIVAKALTVRGEEFLEAMEQIMYSRSELSASMDGNLD